MHAPVTSGIPRKVKATLDSLGITNVFNGYMTTGFDRQQQPVTYFTGWDKGGNVVCVLRKTPGQSQWELC